MEPTDVGEGLSARGDAGFAQFVREQGGKDQAVEALQVHYHAKLAVAASVKCSHSEVRLMLPWIAYAEQLHLEADVSDHEVLEPLSMKSKLRQG